MAVADGLVKLSERAKEAEERARAAASEKKDELRASVEQASSEANKKAEELRTKMDSAKGAASDWWTQMQDQWANHVAKVQANLAATRVAADIDLSQADADIASADASAAIDFAMAAVDEAEYAVLDAIYAQSEADELAGRG